ncbi:zinc transporter ZIP3 [Teleopsis dalmanni]|uniref:zinc transporter ZIP3 n=1 Tax=Teleopsis dalmanni TaxID=139649 RepID=UPI0018CFB2E7|nr:zinc transporter ZIP3 [Teleopsis dalmanni]
MEVLNNSDVENSFKDITSDINRGDGEKYLAMTILGFGSFITGMLPALISERNRRRFPLSTSVLLCFGAGILLATALVHILPEVRKQMSSNYAEISLCAGFFIIYFIDEFIHYFFGDPGHHITPISTTAEGNTNPNTNRNYGTVNTEREHLLATTSNDNISQQTLCTHNINIHGSHNHTNRINMEQQGNHSHRHSHGHGHGHSNTNIDSVDNEHLCYIIHAEPCVQQTLSGTLGLFVALSMHSAIEGLAIGVQNSASKVLFLLGAVACHKFVMGFCLGLEFRTSTSTQTNLRTQFIGILVFALGAVCGIGIGMIIVDIPTKWATTTLPIIQALAGGTLLYVTVCEVIPREKARWHQNSRRIAGFSQFLAVCCGFVAMTLINFYVGDNDA